MEKRFKIPSKNMGFIATGNDITSFMLSSFIAYYGGRGRRDLHTETDNTTNIDRFFDLKVTGRDGWHLESSRLSFIA